MSGLAGSRFGLARVGLLGRTHELRLGTTVLARLRRSGTVEALGEVLALQGAGKDAEGAAAAVLLDDSGKRLAFLEDSGGERVLGSDETVLRPRVQLRFKRPRPNEWAFVDPRGTRLLRLHAARGARGHIGLERSPDPWPAHDGGRAELLAALLGCALLLPRTGKRALERSGRDPDFILPVTQ